MNEQIPTDLNGQVEYVLRNMQKEDMSKGLPPWSENEQRVYRENILTQFQERSPEYLQNLYGFVPATGTGQNSNFSNSAQPKPDFSQQLQQTSKPLPPTTSFYELLQPFYGDKTDQEFGAAQGYVEQNYPQTGTSGARQNIPQSFGSKLFSRFTPEQAQQQIPIVPTYNEKPAVYDSRDNSIYAGRGLQNLIQPMGNAMYNTGLTSRIDEPRAANDPSVMIPELANAQRQHFQQTGSRMSPEQLEGYLQQGDYSKFQDPTRKTLEQLNMQRQSQDPTQQQQYQDTLRILPSLVQNRFSQQNPYV